MPKKKWLPKTAQASGVGTAPVEPVPTRREDHESQDDQDPRASESAQDKAKMNEPNAAKNGELRADASAGIAMVAKECELMTDDNGDDSSISRTHSRDINRKVHDETPSPASAIFAGSIALHQNDQ